MKNMYQKSACQYFLYIKIPLSLTLFPEFSVSLHLQLSQRGELINGKYAFLPGREKIIQISKTGGQMLYGYTYRLI